MQEFIIRRVALVEGSFGGGYSFKFLLVIFCCFFFLFFFLFKAEGGIRYLVRSRGLGDVYKRQVFLKGVTFDRLLSVYGETAIFLVALPLIIGLLYYCLLYTSDAADERSSVDLGGRRIIKKKKTSKTREDSHQNHNKHNRESQNSHD